MFAKYTHLQCDEPVQSSEILQLHTQAPVPLQQHAALSAEQIFPRQGDSQIVVTATGETPGGSVTGSTLSLANPAVTLATRIMDAAKEISVPLHQVL